MPEKLSLDRDNYRKIKAKSREEMLKFLQEIYLNGKEDAIAETETVEVDFEKIRSEIGAIKGIGETRLNQIMTIIKDNLTNK